MRRGLCRVCGAADLDAVYLVEGSVKYPKQRAWYPERIHICKGCHGRGETPVDQWYVNPVRWTRVAGRGDLMPPTPCEHCGLNFIRNADPLLKRMTCSAACLTSLSDSRNAARGNKGTGQPCETCGEQITTGRADSRYCGSACRQKAYRRRGAKGAAAAPLLDARGRRMPQRSQLKALQAGMAHLSGLCGAFAGVDAVAGPATASEVSSWQADLANAERVLGSLHQKLQDRSGVEDEPVEPPRPSGPARRRHLSRGTQALSGVCSGLAKVKDLSEDITPELAARWQVQAVEALAGIRALARVLDVHSHT